MLVKYWHTIFNLDVNMEMRPDYLYKSPLSHLIEFANANNLTQLVSFNTWSRTINGVRKESLLDHVYVNEVSLVKKFKF